MNDALKRQAQKIDEYRQRTEKYRKTIAGRDMLVLPKVFPGGTDTALLCDTVKAHPGERILDLCTGAGAVAIAAAQYQGTSVVGTDISPIAIENANLDKAEFGLANVNFMVADVYPENESPFDVITINPPYTDNEAPDIVAACFWDKGNRVVKSFFAGMRQYLNPGGRAYMTWPSFADPDLPISQAEQNNYAIQRINRRASGSSGFEYYVYLIKP
jgi:release factor glutamine methyltransferase